MSGLIGKKLGMTQIFNEAGAVIPVTVLEVGPCEVLQKKTREQDGYPALQLGFREKKLRQPRGGQPLPGQKKKPVRRFEAVREFRLQQDLAVEAGARLTVDLFREKEQVKVTGQSKGRGFQGVIKRHGKAGGPASHGSRFHRTPGSIGQRTSPGRVFKNMKLPGHMGAERVTVSGLTVVGVRLEDNVLLIKGAVPGPINGLVLVKSQAKDFEARLVAPTKELAVKQAAEAPAA